MMVRLGSLALVLAALLTVFFWRNAPSPPPARPAAVGSFDPPPAEMRPPAVAAIRPPLPRPLPARVAVDEDDADAISSADFRDHGDRDRADRDRDSRSSRRRDADRRATADKRERLPRISVEPGGERGGVSDDAFTEPSKPDAGSPPVSRTPPVGRPPPADPPAAARPPPLPPRLAPPSDPPTTSPTPTGSLDAVASLSRVDVQGPLQASVLRRALERVLPSVRACYRAAATRARRTPILDIKVGFEIDDARAARAVHAASTPLAGLSSCVADAIGRARTRVAPDVGYATVDVTITFTPTP
jgi:hypothetical protein